MNLSISNGLLGSKSTKSAKYPSSKIPDFIFNIFAGLSDIFLNKCGRSIILSLTNFRHAGNRVCNPIAPKAAFS